MNGDSVIICDDASVVNDKNHEVYKSVLEGTVSRYIVSTLKSKADTIGYLLVDNFSKDLSINVREVIESISIFISEELRNDRLVREMSYMSNHDELTWLGNRHAYSATIHMLEGMTVSVGICFIDINGLKLINDTEGHDSGDNMIKETAEVITAVFKMKYCYRIGGDEFIIMIPQAQEEHFAAEIEKLKKKAKNIPIALGAVWSDTAKDIQELINQADKLMYADKAAYYTENDRRK